MRQNKSTIYRHRFAFELLETRRLLATIEGFKWNDADGDGVFDSNESGLADWTIFLDQNRNQVLDAGEPSAVTAADGSYLFTNLDDGTYFPLEVNQKGWRPTYPANELREQAKIYANRGPHVGTHTLSHFDIDGSNKVDLVEDIVSGVGIDNVNQKLYWSLSTGRFRSNMDGTNIESLPTNSGNDYAFDISNNRFFFTVNNLTFSTNLDTFETTQLHLGFNTTNNVDYDPITDTVFIVNNTGLASGDSIFAVPADGSAGPGGSATVTKVASLPDIGGVAVDPMNRNMYYTDGRTGRVFVSDLDGTNLRTVVDQQTLLGRGGGIDVIPELNLLVWAGHDTVYRSNLDGSDLQAFSLTPESPKSLAIFAPMREVTVANGETVSNQNFGNQQLRYDFGDAPDRFQAGTDSNYSTTTLENGARHLGLGPILGSARDMEDDGVHSLEAKADDDTGSPDDEDGVVFHSNTLYASFATELTYSVDVTLGNADPASNRLDAWIDFDRDGQWGRPGDPFEQIFDNFDLGTANGTQTLTFTVPQDLGANVELGKTYARFRLSTNGDLFTTNAASDGEVEDHQVVLAQAEAEVPRMLNVDVAAASISEATGPAATTVTVTRNFDLDIDLTVGLTSDDTSEATLPATITIPKGAMSATVNLDAVDDALGDGIQSVTLSAALDGAGLDPTFGDEGSVPIPSQSEFAAVTTQSNGKIVTLGEGEEEGQIVIARYNADGTLDKTFDGDGTVEVIVSTTVRRALPKRVLIQPDGKILLGGRTAFPNVPFLVRLEANGSLDTTYGNGGVVFLSGITSLANQINDMALTSDGKLLAAMARFASPKFLVMRVNTDGTLDTTFGTDGILEIAGDPAFSNAVTTLSDGRFVLVGARNNSTYVVRANADGTLDTTFGVAGRRLITWPGVTLPNSVQLDPLGRVVIGVSQGLEVENGTTIGVARLTPNGDIDTSFDNDGILMTDIEASADDDSTSIEIEANSRIWVVGHSVLQTVNNKLQIIRYNTDGSIDRTFDSSGVFNLFGNGRVGQVSIDSAMQPDGSTYALFGSGYEYRIAKIIPDSLVLRASDLVEVIDDETAALTVTIDADSIGENGGSTIARVTRTIDTSNELVVQLSSSDTGELSVPESITIPAGLSTSAPFTITGVDDEIVDRTQSVLVRAMADGFQAGTDTIDVTDDDLPELIVSVLEDSISENAGTSIVTVTRNTDVHSVLTIALASSDTDEAVVPDSISIAPGSGSATFIVSGVDDSIVDGPQTVTITATAQAHADASDSVEVSDDEVSELTVVIGESIISENGGTSQVSVIRNRVPTADLFVTLASNDTGEAKVPASVTIPAGAVSATFTVTGVDDLIVDGTQTASITASAASHLDGVDTVGVTDNDIPELTFVIEADEISENGGTSQATVSRNTIPTADLIVTLTSDDTGEATAPETVTIPAGAAFANFTISGVDDAIVDGTQGVTVAASAEGHTDATAAVDVTDDEVPKLTLVIDKSSINENGGNTQVSVSRNTDTTSALTVTLSSSDTSEAAVPSSITIPSGAASVSFTASGVDDLIADGLQTVTLTATAAGHAEATDAVDVTDDDVAELTLVIDEDSISENGGATQAIVSRNTDTTSELLVILSSSDTSEAAVPGAVTIASGAASVSIAVTGVDDPIVDGTQIATVTATSVGHAQASDTISVTDDDVPELALVMKASSISENGGTTQATVLRNTDTKFALTVTLASSDTGAASVPSLVTIPSGAASVSFTVTGVDDPIVDGTQIALLTANAPGRAGASATIDVTDDDVPELMLSIDESSISENGGTTQATVSRNTNTELSLTVMLSSDDTSEAAVPSSVTIPAGAASVSFTVSGVDDPIVDGTQTVTISAIATGHADATESVDITNDDGPMLGLVVDEDSLSENGGTAQAVVTRNSDTTLPLVLTVNSSDTSEVSVPMSVTMPAGEMSISILVNGVDDHVVDGTQTVTLTVTATGHATATESIDVTDDDVPELTLVIDESSISENGGTTQATVLRNTDTTSELVVTLSSSDTSEATVPETVTIPAGTASVTFTLHGVDDAFVDGTQGVTVGAMASGYADATASVDVTDDDVPELTLVIDEDSISEYEGTTQATVSRNTDTTSSLVVTLSSSDTSEATVPSSVTIPAGVDLVSFMVTGVDDAIVDGPQAATLAATAVGHAEATGTVDVTDDDVAELTLVIDESSISENGGTTQATVSRNTDTTSELVVTLSSSDTSEATVPETVTIPAGTAWVTFTLNGVDDAIVDGIQSVAFGASASGHADATATVDVTDDDVAGLTLVIGEYSIGEDGGITQATVSRNTNTELALTVMLSSDDTSEATVPSSVTMPAGAAFVSFAVSGVDDPIVDGTQIAMLTAMSAGHAQASKTISVTDDDVAELMLLIDESSISENGGTTQATVSRNTNTELSLTVMLSSDDTSEADVPSSVTIPAGAASVSFTVSGVDDPIVDGTQTVTISAIAMGHADATESVDITNDDGPMLGLVVDEDSLSENGGTAQAVVTRNSDTTLPLVLTVNSSDTSEVSVPMSVTMPAGEMSISILVNGVDDHVVDGTQTVTLTVTATGHATATESIDVTDDDVPELTLVIDESSISENGGTTQATVLRNTDTTSELVVTLSSSDTSEATVPETVTIPAGTGSVTFTLNGVDDAIVDGTQGVTVGALASGYADATATVDVTDDDLPELTLVIDESSISENGGTTQATVSRNTDTTSSLVVTLSSSDTGEAVVPSSVTIPAGFDLVSFMVTGVDDAIVDGPQAVTLTATIVGHAEATSAVDVTDDDVAELTLVIDEDSISENGGTTQATVSRNSDTDSPLMVMLASSDMEKATVPSSVTIPAGATSFVFQVSAINDSVVGSDVTVTIAAAAVSHESSQSSIIVVEDDLWSWTNAKNRLDVNDDGFVSPIDALIIINFLNSALERELPSLTEKPVAFYDINSDNFVSPSDALIVINKLNSQRGEGEEDNVWAGISNFESDSERIRRRSAIDEFFGQFDSLDSKL